jgi:hypothetical protein
MPRLPHVSIWNSPSRLAMAVAVIALALGFSPDSACGQAGGQAGLDQLHKAFANPPDDARIMMRWWWFGPAATRPEITRELEQMKAAGIGGVEIANLYPLALDDAAIGFHNTPFLSVEHLQALGFANEEARRLGLRLDITLGSGWPFGGPHIPVTEAAGKLRVESISVAPGATSALAPFVDTGEEMLAIFLAPGTGASSVNLAHATQLTDITAHRLEFAASPEARTLLCFLSSRTGMVVKRPSIGADGFVLDHYDRAATENHLHAVGDKLLSAFGDHPPYAVFSDSLEDYASDWTPKLLSEFERRRGYDLRPHLPALIGEATPETAAIRHDWGRTLTELADENFLAPMQSWATAHHTLLRSQTYGFPPVSLSSNRIADLPEGEGKAVFQMWREFSDTRWAASAAHLFHRPVVSSETWTWLHSPAFRATPLDLKAEADLHFLQGINQLVGHGWPYSPPGEPEPGWRMYAAAALDAHNPWFIVMPELTRYLQRVSFALRQGQPANDVALLLPTDDVWASFKAGVQPKASPTSPLGFDTSGSNVTLDESMGKILGDKVIASVLDAGFNLDFIDADAIDSVGIPYRVLILPSIDRLPVATLEKISAFARKGGIVIATGRPPATSPGFLHADQDSSRVKEISRQLFQETDAPGHFIASEDDLGNALAKYAKQDMTLTPATPAIGFLHRKLPQGDLYFVANTSNETKHAMAKFRDIARHAELWDAMTGETLPVPNPTEIELNLAPYESRLILFSDQAPAAQPQAKRRETQLADLSSQWTIRFGGTPQPIATLTSWATDARTRYFSGVATYEKSFDAPAEKSDSELWLDFGPGTKVALPSPPGPHNMRAYLDSPIREAARIYVNGQLAGSIWHPPYRIEITRLTHPGKNNLRIEVANTAINELAGQPMPSYRLLWDRFGTLFAPQDMQNLEPLPSGLLGEVKLLASDPAK